MVDHNDYKRAGNYKIIPLIVQCWLQWTLGLVTVITFLGGQVAVNCPSAFL